MSLPNVQTRRPFKERVKRWDIVKNRWIYLLLLPSLIFMLVFAYLPMIGIVIAFEDYDPMLGFFKSAWIGMENFKFFFSSSSWLLVTLNTLYLNALFIITGTVGSLIIAVVMSEIKNKWFTRVAQTFMTLPNFVSWATIALFSVAFFSVDGILNKAVTGMGGSSIPFYSSPDMWPLAFVLIRLWKGAGWGAIVYMAAILGIDKEIYEAARIDGASRLRCIFKITLPLIKNIVILMFIMSIGNIFKGDFGMIYPFIGDNALLYPTTDVIDTYVYRALRTFTNYGRTAAIGLYQSVMGFALVLFANWLARRHSPEAAVF
ncbi:ABC transporter permease [Pumilibacter intestinalis]|uniref:ABC transporter permease n=1 Tax=Pumilibacter intestinalis TaxID=2941511 RepID=UPI002040D090|nr:ABC transporter permease subunit [Pumilibacter intestinalis]MCI8487140.1 sugar ABC transporter permease [Clostridia bacterium]